MTQIENDVCPYGWGYSKDELGVWRLDETTSE
jgi:hypothetical protein